MPYTIEDGLEQVLREVESTAVALRKPLNLIRPMQTLSRPGLSVLGLLSREPGLTVPQVARQRGSSRQNIQVLVDRLSAAGFLEHRPNPDHRRSERLQLTRAGTQVLNDATTSQTTLLDELSEHVTAEELLSCLATLRRIREGLGGRRPSPSRPDPRGRRSRLQTRLTGPASQPQPAVERVAELSEVFAAPEELPVNLL